MRSYTTLNLNTITYEFSVVYALLPLIHKIHQNLTIVPCNMSSSVILMVIKDIVYMILIITKPSHLMMSFFTKIILLLPKHPLSNLYRPYLSLLTSLIMLLPLCHLLLKLKLPLPPSKLPLLLARPLGRPSHLHTYVIFILHRLCHLIPLNHLNQCWCIRQVTFTPLMFFLSYTYLFTHHRAFTTAISLT
jgi:hypothetical protein